MEYHWIYILELENGCYYTGYTGNLEQRYRLHLAGRASKYTRSFKPVRIARSWQLEADRGTAMKVEALIKKRGRKAKESLVANPEKLAVLVLAATGLELRVTAVSAGFEAP
jgi:putative endonuclease